MSDSESFEGQGNDFFKDLIQDFQIQKKMKQQQTLQKIQKQTSNELQSQKGQTTLEQKIQKIKRKKHYKQENLEQNSRKSSVDNKKTLPVQEQSKETVKTKRENQKPQKSFAELGLIKPLLKACIDSHYTKPTPIQQEAIPVILEGKDILANAVTGSGKTAAFLLPMLQKFSCKQTHNYSKVLIIIPTRELAIQCYEVLQNLNSYTKLSSQLIIAYNRDAYQFLGATDIKRQQIELRRNPDFIIATPGRLIDLIKNSRAIDLDYIEVVIFDEADKLLELGFDAEIQEIVKNINPLRQTLLFSATLTSSVKDLAKLALRNPIKVQVDPDLTTARHIFQIRKLRQEIVKIRGHDLLFRESVLLCIAKEVYKEKVIIFFKTKKQCHRMAILFGLLDLKSCELHGNLSQSQRTQAFEQFKQGTHQYLLATDLAARGLDIPGLQTVINFELPIEIQRYIHRVGRTARAGLEGVSLTLCDEIESKSLKSMVKKTGDTVIKKQLKEHVVKKYLHQIQNLEQDYNEILQKEMVEKEIRRADQDAQKAQNMMDYKDEIFNRPKREWIVSKTEKDKINQMQRQQLGIEETDQSSQKKTYNVQKKRQNSLQPQKKVKR